jgi:hypothetical protein
MQRITISDDASFQEFRPRRKRGQRGSEDEAPEIYSEPVSPKYRAIERDEPFLVEKKSKNGHEEIMSKPDFELMTDDEAQTKSAMREAAPIPVERSPLPYQEDVVAFEDDLPEEIDEADIPDMDVPEEEKPAPPEPKPRVKKAPVRHEPRKARREEGRKVRRSPIHEQFSGMPFLSQTSVDVEKTNVTGIFIAIGAIAVIAGLIYFIKRGS